jgi:hypothetical protein
MPDAARLAAVVLILAPMAALAQGAAAAERAAAPPSLDWSQWGRNAQHGSATAAVGQPARRILADLVYDPFVAAEKGEPTAGGDLLVHYQVPILSGNDVFMAFKGGEFTGAEHWETQTWSEKRLRWVGRRLVPWWTFTSDWKPVPYAIGSRGPNWEPVFHPVLAGAFLYVPGAGGSVFKVNRTTGARVARISPFTPAAALDPEIFVAGPLTADARGNVYYNAIKLTHGNEWLADAAGSWLVKIAPNGRARTATIASLTPDAPRGTDRCPGSFDPSQLPWPPSPDAVPPTETCGSQRVGLNIAPAVAPDGTVYTASVAHLSDRTAYLIAARPDLSPKWAASLSDRLDDGCGVLLPPNGAPGGCRAGARAGVDPAQNRPGGGQILDNGTASPIVAPDGSVLFGVATRYNWFQGHLMKFAPDGSYRGAFPFGWDTTPGIRVHDGTWSIVTKENHYNLGSYCFDERFCPHDRTAATPASPEAYYITQLDRDLHVEWRWQNTNPLSCSRDAGGHVSCVSDHPDGFEFCVNAPAIDRQGNVYNNSEDGNLYVVRPDGTLREHLFLDLALGAAYTPVSIGADGRIYTQNDGHLFVVGR